MKVFYFELHPKKNYLWRLTPAAQNSFATLIENFGFCSKEYYTKELSIQMYEHIKENEAQTLLNELKSSETSTVVNINQAVLDQMFLSLLTKDTALFLRAKNRLI